ncbi:hypothetical protein BDV38DRAFT_258236 [Aspergillus pseudotamarii]|uniref:F-box domain-containing protein n=1 Tax=Aspergillus pseudotamarii TaxID=132259 RepID=A0A5N6SFJ8_ASPPS|nr:uncharacterized protein BDV38DRAFT_258236 [Aspergillus pseudotamarii]KAE8133498.1 hypothetical protein BDV38DRAFT_258236 [Aspergillus pseudotamarii]
MSPSLGLGRSSRTFRAFVHKMRSPRESFFSARLCNLPLELLLKIGASLDCPALCSFRLACESLYDYTLPQFCMRLLSQTCP